MSPTWSLLRTKWQSTSMCLVLSWKTGLWAMWMADWLSQKTGIGEESGIVNSFVNLWSQTSSPTTFLMDLYSAFAEDNEMVYCFFDFQLIGLFPSRTKYPLTDLLESGQDAQSESQYALIEQSESLDRWRPRVGSCFKYLSRWNAACKCEVLGSCINWFKCWTRNAISSLVLVRKFNFPLIFCSMWDEAVEFLLCLFIWYLDQEKM